MVTFFKNFGQRYTEHMVNIGRKHAREALLGKSDRLLEDMGISRDLLEKGVDHWPWTLIESQPVAAVQPVRKLSRREERRAIRALQGLSDRELLDIGITRGNIAHAVRYGRWRDADQVAAVPATAVAPTTLQQADVERVVSGDHAGELQAA